MEQKVKPFDLQKALNGAKAVTRDGREVLNIAYLPDAPDNQKVICVIRSKAGVKEVYHYYPGGNMWLDPTNAYAADLFMVPIEKEYWTASGKGINSNREILCTRLAESEEEIRRLVLGTGLIPETIQFHKITRLE
jgi:hypothetical protein